MKRTYLAALLLFSIALIGCQRRSSVTRTSTSVQGQNYLLDHTAFDLGTITAKVKASQLKNAEELETFINSDGNGVNNVDLDNDGKVDYIAVRDSETEKGKLDFVAYPATKGESGATTIAQLSVTRNSSTNEVVVSGAYPDYVSGYNDHYYHYNVGGPSLGQMLFLNYMLDVTRPRYRPAYTVIRTRPLYSRRTVVIRDRGRLSSIRTGYRTRTRITAPRVVKRPRTYTIKSASKTRSRLAKTRATGSSLKSRSGSARSYQKRNASKPKARGSAFGSGSRRRATTPKRTTPKRTTPSRSRSRSSWGSKRSRTPSRSRSRSSWGSSRSRSRGRSRSRRR